MKKKVEQLARLLDEMEQLDVHSPTSRVDELFEKICSLTFEDEVYKDLWAERILNQLLIVFEKYNPDPEIFGNDLKKIEKRSCEGSQINDFFFAVLNPSTSADELCILLEKLAGRRL